MPLFSADLIFPIHLPPIKNGVVVTDDQGKIIDLLDPEKNEIPASAEVSKLRGIICPGFINAHCHLELSNMKGKFNEKQGLPAFIGQMVELRNKDEDKVMQAMIDADDEMHRNGTVAVGDISNVSVSSVIKKGSKIFYHTFIELFDIFPERAEVVFKNGLTLQAEFEKEALRSSIVPHAPYTVTHRLLQLITANADKKKEVLCIHNQESSSENDMFETGKGSLIEKLNQMTGAFSDWKSSGTSSVRTIINEFPSEIPLQLVHNTFSKVDDVRVVAAANKNIFWCLCPNANLFIENTLPDILMLNEARCRITIGTDSYSSNHSLSILDEIKVITQNFPEIGLDDLLRWSTFNGAEFLGIDRKFGSLEKGKVPGLNLLKNVDVIERKLHPSTTITRII